MNLLCKRIIPNMVSYTDWKSWASIHWYNSTGCLWHVSSCRLFLYPIFSLSFWRFLRKISKIYNPTSGVRQATPVMIINTFMLYAQAFILPNHNQNILYSPKELFKTYSICLSVECKLNSTERSGDLIIQGSPYNIYKDTWIYNGWSPFQA